MVTKTLYVRCPDPHHLPVSQLQSWFPMRFSANRYDPALIDPVKSRITIEVARCAKQMKAKTFQKNYF